MTKPFLQFWQLLKNPTPSKWGPGTGLLWNGNSLDLYWDALISSFFQEEDPVVPNNFLFESSRVAIYHYAKFLDLQPGDTVQIMGFTCDAVTDALRALRCNLELYDCNSSMQSPDFEIAPEAKLIVSQVSFGVHALSEAVLLKAQREGIPILLDKSLSYGMTDFESLDGPEFPEVMSFEVSKSFTIGWGGLLRYPLSSDCYSFERYYQKLGAVSSIDDFSRIIRTVLNLGMSKSGSKLGYWAWLFLRVIGGHRLSSQSSKSKYKQRAIMGKFSRKIFSRFIPRISSLLERANANHRALETILIRLGLQVISKVDRNVSTPRIVFLIDEGEVTPLQEWLSQHNFELGTWFNELPIRDEEAITSSLSGTVDLMGKVVNLPCHWSISAFELERLETCLEGYFSGSNHAEC